MFFIWLSFLLSYFNQCLVIYTINKTYLYFFVCQSSQISSKFLYYFTFFRIRFVNINVCKVIKKEARLRLHSFIKNSISKLTKIITNNDCWRWLGKEDLIGENSLYVNKKSKFTCSQLKIQMHIYLLFICLRNTIL